MREWAPQLAQKRISWAASTLWLGFLLLAIVLADSRPATALPLTRTNVYALPAFARKYGMPCSSCHEAWPKLSPFGQSFKDNGYQMGNDRDAPIFQQPAYWPVTFRITPIWHRESINRVGVDGPTPGSTVEAQVTTHGFDWTGLDFHTAGTLAKNFSFYVLPSSDNTGAFHFEAVWTRFDNLFGSTWLNLKVGKFELDNLQSEKRTLTLSTVGGGYQNYHFQPFGESTYKLGIGDNQVGVELMGHSKNDRTRYSVSLLSSNDGTQGLPTSRGYDTFLAASQGFEVGSLGMQRVGAFAYIGQAPTFFQYTQTTTTPVGTDINGNPVTNTSVGNVAGTGIGNKGFYRAGLIGMWYIKKLDLTTMYFHGWDSAFLGTSTAANTALPAGAQAPTWNGGLFETHYTLNPQLIFINRYELIRMSRQAFTANPGDLGNIDVLTFGYRYYPFISSRAGFAFHNEFAILRQRGASLNGLDLTSSSLLIGFDFAF
ncbi:MAG TPA: hypothetical protein VHF01_01890 [Candidatus Acidoferrum sp.]|nr:hypothetical protein [Candidatus Acidoferrum sp.]